MTPGNRFRLHDDVDHERRAAGADARNRQPRGDRRRQQILDAAVELFSSRGYRNTGILTLADRVGLSDTGLLYYFGSKERLLHEVVAERPQVRFPVSDEELTLGQLRDLGRRYADERTLTRLYLVLAAESLNEDDPLHDFFLRRYRRGVEFVAGVLGHDRERGAIRADVDVGQIAFEILATELGLELMWLMDPGIDIAAIRARHIDHLVGDLAPRSPGARRAISVDPSGAEEPGGAAYLPSEVEQLDVAGVTVYSVTPANLGGGDDRVLLELHQGGFTGDVGPRCRADGAVTANRMGMSLWAVDYRTPPEHPYPAGLDDALSAYRGLLARARADRIVVHGARAGGNLAAALVLRARDEGLPLPGAVVLLSPYVDLTDSGDSHQGDLVHDAGLVPANLLYSSGADVAHPYMSPLFGDFTRGFPPVFVTSGTRDPLLSDAVRLHQRLRAADLTAELYVLEAAPHGRSPGSDPEDRELDRQARRFVDVHVPRRTADAG